MLTCHSAGVTDSALTNHGVLQASHLGAYLAATGVKVAHLFSSDLQRAVQTAEAIRAAQPTTPAETTILEVLREQDFGYYEGKKTFKRPRDGSGKSGKQAHADAHRNDPGFRDVESKASMQTRMEKFVDEHLLDILCEVQPGYTVVIVAHGIILIYLWRVILKRLPPKNITIARGVQPPEPGFAPSWSNTGYMDLEITPGANTKLDQLSLDLTSNDPESTQRSTLAGAQSPSATEVLDPLPNTATDADPLLNSAGLSVGVTEEKLARPLKFLNISLVVKALNNQEHLKGLKKSGGGLGSLKHDSSQKTLDSFLKKRRLE